ncbi:helix-turn-helix domain-containing protein [Caproiciproducens faecalis]|uniref:Helix-turn-helix domain-containing protein n=1 Tax=Caproiciproducens faecalis TaxID=2820301 RepID=A0ABS7DPA8_9FIRM|nr:helix-turn-helix domain-containing protein [Caproiciproducens faecalis]MBW7573146.1 helix-turn-helix domain-containing protein [Caproiciproducens faecalis]
MKGYFVSNVTKIVRKLELTAKAVHVYFYLAECSNINGECWPSKKTIAEACKISVATVTRALRELEKAGMVISEPRRRLNNGQTSNRYTVFTEPQDTKSSGQPGGIEEMEDTKQDVIDLPNVEKACEQHEIPEYISDVPADIPTGENHMGSTVPGRQKQSDHHAIPRRQKSIPAQPLSASRLLKLQLFCRLLLSQFDMAPRINMTPQGTNSTTKVTLKQRKKDFISKIAKRKFPHKREYGSDKSGDG